LIVIFLLTCKARKERSAWNDIGAKLSNNGLLKVDTHIRVASC